MRTLEGLLQEEQREVVVLQESLTQESKLLKETRAKVDQVSGFTNKLIDLDDITFNGIALNVWE